ncbi:hypothetical protein MD273_17895 [Marinobacter pelagius]|uniref:MaoC family dehydratase n=1 Tax=Marinobacter sp. C7 TaxID=2951363 RepID=UPI001EF01326|nr:MaoC/PaaZ C-terminal domain-containing protein [Marinobacter sp. C7]MCG7201613.1 hypothetical protein [Marinobacter sp. C7]
MPNPLIFHHTPPPLVPLFAKALLPKQAGAGGEPEIPALEAHLLGASTITRQLRTYREVCGFGQHTHTPITWPHILAFPLHLKLLTEPEFPLPLLGLVHLRNTITQQRPIGEGESLDLTVGLANQQRTDRGIEFDLVTEARSAGTLVWEETSTNLFRRKHGNSKPGAKPTPPELERYPETVTLKAPESIGRQYGSVSGDRNPIHMHALTARAFGFPRAIAHGMWSQARVLALLEQQEGWRDGALRVSCQFKKPLFLPGTAQLNWHTGEAGWDYQLLNSNGDAPHLSGRIDWL